MDTDIQDLKMKLSGEDFNMKGGRGSLEIVSLIFVFTANVLYCLAAFTHAWFQLPPHSFYGLWWVKFCDCLRCQIIPAFYAEEPAWYHVMQGLSLTGWISLVVSMMMLLSKRIDVYLPIILRTNRQVTVSALCLLSVSAISTSIIMFYSKLDESSPKETPQISWSTGLAALACFLELSAAMLLLIIS
ncbi:uncharacterized protein LOC106881196 [Octopus bimaculoides]|uniref:Uncharacterized protein n=1 Tax=Octopus bimaculoides TaxID=37653 RepID=A0A0L8FTT7_OCTBM|nr:uncharacterized protein LOC106881196 [Octopus bimaculoides]XP_052827366.1 uncharacterized protein LOC106881196 [Octopus bimaculoides]XP_052827367.1 uncharacterized protein LOC106881196 [Octopus bimaculoides]|eukprot:XP_014786978.1 PREDICTED: uncharacterized protein LOC106881196 [Octopus bimaculoides]